MNKKQFIKEIAQTLTVSMDDANDVIDAIFDTITDCLLSGQEVNLHGFGKFSIAKRNAKAGINPRTKEPMQIAGYYTPTFKAGTPLKKTIKQKFN